MKLTKKDIIAICNLDTASVSKYTKLYLEKCEKLGVVETVCMDIPKTFVVARKNNKDKIYLTNISSTTLLKRTKSGLLV